MERKTIQLNSRHATVCQKLLTEYCAQNTAKYYFFLDVCSAVDGWTQYSYIDIIIQKYSNRVITNEGLKKIKK